MIGILTYHFAINYGAMLQAYALQRFIKENGYNCRIINYIPERIARAYHIHSKDYFSPRKVMLSILRMKQYKLFEKFDRLYLSKESSPCLDLKQECKDCSTLITGSDQVWNVELNGNDSNYFLTFADDDQIRVAYAVSVGSNDIFLRHINSIKVLMNKFEAISFREESTFLLAKDYLNRKCASEAVVDPVFLLKAAEWRRIANKPNMHIPDHYILYYSLTESNDLVEATLNISRKEGLPVLSIHPLCKHWRFGCTNLVGIGPLEFLWLLDHADYICTNSYHGTAFSIVFEKRIVPYAHETLGDRNRQLLKWVDVETNDFGRIVDTQKCNKNALSESVNKSKAFLLRSISKREKLWSIEKENLQRIQ